MKTLEQVKAIVVAAGHKVGSNWEDDRFIHVGSVKTVRGTYGHPAFEANYNKETGRLSVTGIES